MFIKQEEAPSSQWGQWVCSGERVRERPAPHPWLVWLGCIRDLGDHLSLFLPLVNVKVSFLVFI